MADVVPVMAPLTLFNLSPAGSEPDWRVKDEALCEGVMLTVSTVCTE